MTPRIVVGAIPSSQTAWDQRKTMIPAPFKGPLARLVKGLEIGDPRVDALPISAVCCHGGEARKIGMDPHPAWVNWDLVKKGQQVFKDHIGQAYVGLTFSLLQGFSISRFAEVLFHNGYAQSAETAYERYRETSFAIVDWMNYPLDDDNSQAHKQIQNVRAMHSYARRRAMKLFDKSKGEGIALSQYDMAEVQLGFAGIATDILRNEFGVKLTSEELEAWCHVWRFIGYHLGIMDEYNTCNSVEDMQAMVAEYMIYVPARFKTCRRATFELQRTALEGFGMYTGVGVEFFSGLLHASCTSRDWGEDLDYLERPCLPGMDHFAKAVLPLVGNNYVNKVLSFGVIHMRDVFLHHPELAKSRLPKLAALSRVNDSVTWPLVAAVINFFAGRTLRKLIFGYVLGVLSTHYIAYRLIWNNMVKRILSLVSPSSPALQ